jgi:hypothetical protein
LSCNHARTTCMTCGLLRTLKKRPRLSLHKHPRTTWETCGSWTMHAGQAKGLNTMRYFRTIVYVLLIPPPPPPPEQGQIFRFSHGAGRPCVQKTRSRIHECTKSLRFLGIILSVPRLKVSVYNVYITSKLQTTFARGEGGWGGGGKPVSTGDFEEKNLKTFVPITSTNAASVREFRER